MSNNTIAEKLDDCIEQHLDAMATFKVGSEDMQKAINDLARLYKFRIDEAKLDFDYTNSEDQHELDKERVENEKGFKEAQLELETKKFNMDRARDVAQIKEQRIDRYFRLSIAAAELVLPLTVYSVLAMLGYAREFDGVITSATLKRVTNDIKFRK